MSLSSPFSLEDYDFLLPYVKKATEDNQVRFLLEKNLMTTDLFAEVEMGDNWVFIIFKKENIVEDYFALKTEKEHLEKEGKYVGETRKRIAKEMGRLLGYSDQYIDERMNRVASHLI